MGEITVAAGALWGAATQRAIENFPISGVRIDGEVIRAFAEVNERLGVLDRGRARAIIDVATEIADGQFEEQFPVDVFQTGSGTSTNMNINEVISRLASSRAGMPVHPNDHVNASQSSNDAFPSAVHIAAAGAVTSALLPAVTHLTAACDRNADELAAVVKAGRTHLMDAAPVTLGQEFAGYASQLRAAAARLRAALPTVLELPLGGTAVGTGLNAPAGFAAWTIDALRRRTGLRFVEAPDHFAAQGGRDALVGLSGDCRVLAVVLFKIANDVRWMASGPATGLAEIALPALQPGSSIMPGKVNPVLCEAVLQVVVQVIGNDASVAFAGSQGNFELNTFIPVMARNVLESIRLLASVTRLFAERCVQGIVADVDACRRYAERSPAVATALTVQFGYDIATDIVKQAVAEGRTVRDIVVARGLLDAAAADRVLEPSRLARGGVGPPSTPPSPATGAAPLP